MNTRKREESLTLEILEAIEQRDNVTQRHLADQLGVALGLANSYLKRCVRKGLIKIHQAPANRYLYYLTPKGFAEKSRLTAEYLSFSFDFYRRASDSLKDVYMVCHTRKYHQILLCGVSELAEIASLRAHEHEVNIIGTFDPESKLDQFISLPVWQSLDAVKVFDACILTSLNKTNELYSLLINQVEAGKLLVPSILGISSANNIV